MKAFATFRLDDDGVLRWEADWSNISEPDCRRIISRLLGVRRDIMRNMKSVGGVRKVKGSEREKS